MRAEGWYCYLHGEKGFPQVGESTVTEKASKESRPLLDNVVVAEFRKGSSLMFYKESHNDADFKTADFLKLKVLKQIENGDNILPQTSAYKGVSADRKGGIIDNLIKLMPEKHRVFWRYLPAAKSVQAV